MILIELHEFEIGSGNFGKQDKTMKPVVLFDHRLHIDCPDICCYRRIAIIVYADIMNWLGKFEWPPLGQ